MTFFPHIRIAAVILCLTAFFECGCIGRPPGGDGFPRVQGSFGSNTISCQIEEAAFEYGEKVRIVLSEGKLYCRRDIDPVRSPDFYFVGRGHIDVHDTAAIHTFWFDHFGKRTSVAFSTAYLCGDRIAEQIGLRGGEWVEDKIDGRLHRRLQFQLKAPDKYFGVHLGGELGTWSSREYAPLPVWADLEMDNGEQLVCYLSPEMSDQLSLFVYDKKFNEPYLAGAVNLGSRIMTRPAEVDSAIIRVRLNDLGKFEAACELVMNPAAEPRGLRLILPYLFTVDSVLDGGGRQVAFIKKKWRNNLYLAARPDSLPGSDRLRIFYRGKFLEATRRGDMPINITGWYPHPPYRRLGRFIVHYTLHKDLTLLAVGVRTGEIIVGDKKTVTYESTDDISYISFAAGIYDILNDTVDGVPITLYVREENNRGLFNRSIPRTVLNDLTGAFEAFYGWFGPPLVRELKIVDQPFYTGQSSPGLIHLSKVSFQMSRDQSRFRAHETAHQWWGHTVVPRSYRDQWLSEGLAEYSAALYLLDVRHDSAAFRTLTDTWRRQVVQEGKINGQYSRGYRAGPITTGVNFLQSYSPGDYQALVYSKAACLLRMLHFEIDGPHYRTDFFKAMLAEYRRIYSGRQASSADFVAVAGKYIGTRRAEEFFGQWLYGWRIPNFTCSATITPDDKGRDLVEIEIDVSHVSEDFATPYPVELEFADGSRSLHRLDFAGRQKSFLLGPFPQKVTGIRFDPGRIILCGEIEVLN